MNLRWWLWMRTRRFSCVYLDLFGDSNKKDPAFVLDCSGKHSKPSQPKINRWIFFSFFTGLILASISLFSSLNKSFVIANSSLTDLCLNCEGEDSVMMFSLRIFYEFESILCKCCWIEFFWWWLVRIGMNLRVCCGGFEFVTVVTWFSYGG